MKTTLALALGCMLAAAPATIADIPERPENIDFRPLEFEPPVAADFRHALSSGVPVYLYPSHEFPLVTISLTFKGGGYLDPPDMVGVASATGTMMRRGGTTSVDAKAMDERFAFLAANASTFSGDTVSGASLNSLVSNLDESFALFMDMVREPGFDEERFEIYKDEVVEGMKQRNDFAGSILEREWAALMYGQDHFEGRWATKPMVDAMTIEDLRAMHRRIFHPGNLYVAVTGDFEPEEMLARLERAFEGWESGPPASDPPGPTTGVTAGVYHVEKDIPQGKVAIGLRTMRRDDPDYFPALVMNHVLGGGGFTSRITKRVRSDEGLAYSAGSSLSTGVYFPGVFRASFESKSETVARAIEIILDEVERIASEPVSEEELAVARNSYIETFPRTFESKAGTLSVFVSDEITGREDGYWRSYRDNVRAVTAEDVRRVAARLLRPEEMAIVVVGRWDDIAPGDGETTMADVAPGEVEHLPLRDPLTMKPTS